MVSWCRKCLFTRPSQLCVRGICSTEEKDLVRNKLEPFFAPLAQAYMEISKRQPREFFGLRDFYRYSLCTIYILGYICRHAALFQTQFKVFDLPLIQIGSMYSSTSSLPLVQFPNIFQAYEFKNRSEQVDVMLPLKTRCHAALPGLDIIRELMLITWLTCFMCHSFPGLLPNRSFFATHKFLFVVVFLVNVLCPRLPSLVQIFLLIFEVKH